MTSARLLVLGPPRRVGMTAELPSGGVVSPVWEFGPAGTVFLKPFVVSIPSSLPASTDRTKLTVLVATDGTRRAQTSLAAEIYQRFESAPACLRGGRRDSGR